MEDTGTGTEEKATSRTLMDNPTGAAQDAVLEEASTLVGEDRTRTTVEAGVCKGVLITPPTPPIKTDRDCRAAVRTAVEEVGCSK